MPGKVQSAKLGLEHLSASRVSSATAADSLSIRGTQTTLPNPFGLLAVAAGAEMTAFWNKDPLSLLGGHH